MVLINGVDYTRYAVLPIKKQYARDKSLDQAILTLKNLSSETPFEPLGKVEDDGDTFLIGIDNVVQTIFGKNPKYNHTISCIEETKLMEKYFVDTCTFTNSLIKNYLDKQIYSYYDPLTKEELEPYWKDLWNGNVPSGYDFSVDKNIIGNPSEVLYKTPQLTGSTINIRSWMTALDQGTGQGYSFQGYVKVCDHLGNVVFNLKTDIIEELGWDKNIPTLDKDLGSFILTHSGIYQVEYVKSVGTADVGYQFYGVRYLIYSTREIRETPDLTITDIVNRLLAITETQRVGEIPKFKFDENDAIKYSKILAPEPAITNSTLREALQQVGNYIHAEPRLRGNTVYFEDLNTREYAKLPQKHLAYSSSQDIEQFCSEINSNVNNLVNIDDEQSGTIVEPFANGLKTTRTELATVDVKDATAFIETTKPIEKIIKVEFGFINGSNDGFKDITKYIYEQAEYTALDGYGGAYPFSKAYALYYKQGSPNIYGLNFEQEHAVHPAFEKFAIINILESEYGISIDEAQNPIAKMQFRVTYIPLINARVKQRKSYLGATKKKAVLNYNASANKVDTDYYGENLKGAIARFGNIEKVYTYIIKEKKDIPKAGQLFNKDYVISVVSVERLNNFYKVTIGISKDFNRWNEYVEINSNQRFYEVSEKQAEDRYVVYEDYLVIGDNMPIETNSFEKSLVELPLLNTVKGNLLNTQQNMLTAIEFTGYTKDNEEISTFILPVISFALGNSVVYQISANNNYGAGTYIQNFNSFGIGVQGEVAYSDDYGNIESIAISGFARPSTVNINNYNSAVEIGSKMPYLDVDGEKFFTTGQELNDRIRLLKDSREIIHFAYQIHCVTDKENIVVGSALSKMMAIKDTSSSDNNRAVVYILDREIGNIEKDILDLDGTPIELNSISVDEANKELTFGTITANRSGKSIVLVDRTTSELIFAINKEIQGAEVIELPKLMFRHKIYTE